MTVITLTTPSVIEKCQTSPGRQLLIAHWPEIVREDLRFQRHLYFRVLFLCGQSGQAEPHSSGAGGQYKYYGVRVFNEPYLRQEDGNFAGYPKRTFVGDTYQDGYSDHFPVFLILVKELKK